MGGYLTSKNIQLCIPGMSIFSMLIFNMLIYCSDFLDLYTGIKYVTDL